MIQIKKKMYLKKKNKLNIRINVTFLIVLLILSVFLCVFFIGNKMNKSLTYIYRNFPESKVYPGHDVVGFFLSENE